MKSKEKQALANFETFSTGYLVTLIGRGDLDSGDEVEFQTMVCRVREAMSRAFLKREMGRLPLRMRSLPIQGGLS